MAKPSRREVLQRAAFGAASVLTVGFGSTQETRPPGGPEGSDSYEKNLAAPLSDLGREKLKGAIAYAESVRKQRLEYKLPENSEPCTRYVVFAEEDR